MKESGVIKGLYQQWCLGLETPVYGEERGVDYRHEVKEMMQLTEVTALRIGRLFGNKRGDRIVLTGRMVILYDDKYRMRDIEGER